MTGNETILIVDDEKEIRELFKEVFSDAGYRVKLADSGETALNVFDSSDIQLVISDIRMPGMDGIELCRNIRRRSSNVTLFAITGYSNEYTPEQILDVGFSEVLYKPVRIIDLVQTVTGALKNLN